MGWIRRFHVLLFASRPKTFSQKHFAVFLTSVDNKFSFHSVAFSLSLNVIRFTHFSPSRVSVTNVEIMIRPRSFRDVDGYFYRNHKTRFLLPRFVGSFWSILDSSECLNFNAWRFPTSLSLEDYPQYKFTFINLWMDRKSNGGKWKLLKNNCNQ